MWKKQNLISGLLISLRRETEKFLNSKIYIVQIADFKMAISEARINSAWILVEGWGVTSWIKWFSKGIPVGFILQSHQRNSPVSNITPCYRISATARNNTMNFRCKSEFHDLSSHILKPHLSSVFSLWICSWTEEPELTQFFFPHF